MFDEPAILLDPGDRSRVDAVLEPGERVLRASPAAATMQRAGIVAVAYAVPAFAIAWFPMRKALAHIDALAGPSTDRLPLLLFAGFGLVWVAIGLRLLFEPRRLNRLYPHVFHLLTDRRFLAIDRRSGPLHIMILDEIGQMKIFSPFGRLTVRRRGFATGTGARARVRNFDGVQNVEAVAQAVAGLTGVPVGFGQAARDGN